MFYYTSIKRRYYLNNQRISISFIRPCSYDHNELYDTVCASIKNSGIEEYLEYIECISEIVVLQYCPGYQMTISLKQRERDHIDDIKYTIEALSSVLPEHIAIAKYISTRTVFKFIINI